MAGDWIKMRTDLAEDPAVIDMAEALQLDEDTIVGKLHRLWSWADRQTRDGHANGVTLRWLDRHLNCPGIAQALVEVGWLAVGERQITILNFDRHNGETAKNRAKATIRKQKSRAGGPGPVPESSRNPRDATVTREEKRREEKKKPEAGELSLSSQPAAPAGDPKAERLAVVADEAIAAFNRILAKPAGLLSSVHPTVGRDKRRQQVGRCTKTAREICLVEFQKTTIGPEFWEAYFSEVSRDDWLRGVGPYTGAHANWRPDFEYLTRPATMLRVFDRSGQAAA